jgi:hypothetical protein
MTTWTFAALPVDRNPTAPSLRSNATSTSGPFFTISARFEPGDRRMIASVTPGRGPIALTRRVPAHTPWSTTSCCHRWAQ